MSFPSTEVQVALLSPENAAVVIQTRLYVHFCESKYPFVLVERAVAGNDYFSSHYVLVALRLGHIIRRRSMFECYPCIQF